jgi:DNA-binding response OmpR family regulator
MEKGDSILVIEDSQVQRAVIVNLVKELGFVPLAVERFDDTIYKVFENENVSVVLLDLMLLDEDGNTIADGFQICNDIKEANPEMKVVIVSAEHDEAAREFALLQGADGFLAKPFKIEDLEDCLKGM